MKKAISCLLLLSMLTMTGCTGDEASVSQNLEDNKSSTESVSFDIPDIVDPYYNPYNERTATDGEYLYYCTFDAICKMPLQGGETDILYELSDKGSYLWSIADVYKRQYMASSTSMMVASLLSRTACAALMA